MTPKVSGLGNWIVAPVIKLEINEPWYIVGGVVVRTGGNDQRMTIRTVWRSIEFVIPIAYIGN